MPPVATSLGHITVPHLTPPHPPGTGLNHRRAHTSMPSEIPVTRGTSYQDFRDLSGKDTPAAYPPRSTMNRPVTGG